MRGFGGSYLLLASCSSDGLGQLGEGTRERQCPKRPTSYPPLRLIRQAAVDLLHDLPRGPHCNEAEISLSLAGVPLVVPNRSLALGMWMAVRIAAMIPSTCLRPSPTGAW
jgi:hypothetical protein